jgi:hypothetical protein
MVHKALTISKENIKVSTLGLVCKLVCQMLGLHVNSYCTVTPRSNTKNKRSNTTKALDEVKQQEWLHEAKLAKDCGTRDRLLVQLKNKQK